MQSKNKRKSIACAKTDLNIVGSGKRVHIAARQRTTAYLLIVLMKYCICVSSRLPVKRPIEIVAFAAWHKIGLKHNLQSKSMWYRIHDFELVLSTNYFFKPR